MKKSHSPHKILVVRNDKLGDFMLAWPSFKALKQSFPDSHIVALVPDYTRPIAELCPWIDELLIDPGENAENPESQHLLEQVKQHHFDLLLSLFSTTRIGILGWRAGIAQRWAPATKLAQYLANHRVTQRRSQSKKAEFEYNLDLTRACIEANHGSYHVPSGPYLAFDSAETESIRHRFMAQRQIDTDAKLIFIHAGHGGSANNLSLEQYAELAAQLDQSTLVQAKLSFVLTAGPGELEATQHLAKLLQQKHVDNHIFNSTGGLQSFAKHLAIADCFVAGSTGTLHIAGALDRPTVGFYPNRRSATPLRWRTLNSKGRTLAISPPSGIEEDMQQVDIALAAKQVSQFMTQLNAGF